MRTARVMAMVMRVGGDKEGDGEGAKRDGNGNNGGRQVMAKVTKRVMVMVTKVMGKQWRQ